ncbi:FtsX-like permease family protein [Seinonella peptonophila]|uniref:FtsX-like permease family protein n=1 Tax=Seinonella peptonophila TaxID=112248 RepID=A0A1M4SQV9_9BACL|nr:FtsX-like permease family protein [Seinonella peptonophila]SHE34559.1 FtsX-like permease family protein [Seinonella peptonophila]
MTFQQLAFKNIRFHHRQYLAYFLSCTFTVWLFYQYLLLLLHPILRDETIPKQFVAFLYLIQGVIVLFSILFIGYSQSAFLKNRKKEIGLWQVMGMSIKQVTRILFWENMVFGCVAILIALLMGTVTSKLFFLGVSAVLELEKPIPFHFSIEAVIITILGYLILFSLLSYWARYTVKKVAIVDLFREAVQPKKTPRFSLWLVWVTLLTWIGGYILTFQVNIETVTLLMFPITAMVLLGTYLAYTQASVYLLQRLKDNKRISYLGKNLILFAQLRFRLKDNARILFLVTILTSIVLSSVGISLTYYLKANQLAEEQAPYSLSLINEPKGLTSDKVKQEIKRYGLKLKKEYHIPVFQIVLAESIAQEKKLPSQVSVISENDFLKFWNENRNKKLPKLKDGEVLIARNGGIHPLQQFNLPSKSLAFLEKKWTNNKEVMGVFFNENDTMRTLLVVTNHDFAQIKNHIDPKLRVMVHAYQFDDWQKSRTFFIYLHTVLQKNSITWLNGTNEVYHFIKQIFAPIMFVSLFIGFLFFLAAGSMLYFRLFTEQSYDRSQVVVLQKIGMDQSDAQSTITWQICILFFVPFFIGVCHASVAIKVFSVLFKEPVWSPFIYACIGYFVIYGLYYIWTKRIYVRSIIK